MRVHAAAARARARRFLKRIFSFLKPSGERLDFATLTSRPFAATLRRDPSRPFVSSRGRLCGRVHVHGLVDG